MDNKLNFSEAFFSKYITLKNKALSNDVDFFWYFKLNPGLVHRTSFAVLFFLIFLRQILTKLPKLRSSCNPLTSAFLTLKTERYNLSPLDIKALFWLGRICLKFVDSSGQSDDTCGYLWDEKDSLDSN